MDGKTVRNTVAPGDPDGSEVKLFSAMLHREAIVIAQLRIPDGHQRDHPGRGTAHGSGSDRRGGHRGHGARPARHRAAHLTQQRGGHYALTVKGNQPTVLAQIASVLPPAAPGTEHYTETDRSNGKIVRRSAGGTVPARREDPTIARCGPAPSP